MTENLTMLALSAATPLADHWHDGHWGPWFILIPLFWIAVLVGIFWLLRRGGAGPWRGGEAAMSATDVLERRFAEGQIDEEEYRRRRATLDADRQR
jgi:putative membrane protein